MGNALAWIGEIVNWVGQWIPRWEIVATTHGWVKWIKGSKVVSGGAGIVWHWPATTKLLIYPVVRQTMNLNTQLLETADGKTFIIGGVVTFEIKDLEKILAQAWDADQTIEDIAVAALTDACAGKTWAELRQGIDNGSFYVTMRQEMTKELATFGVRVLKARVSDLAPCRAYRLIQAP